MKTVRPAPAGVYLKYNNMVLITFTHANISKGDIIIDYPFNWGQVNLKKYILHESGSPESQQFILCPIDGVGTHYVFPKSQCILVYQNKY